MYILYIPGLVSQMKHFTAACPSMLNMVTLHFAITFFKRDIKRLLNGCTTHKRKSEKGSVCKIRAWTICDVHLTVSVSVLALH